MNAEGMKKSSNTSSRIALFLEQVDELFGLVSVEKVGHQQGFQLKQTPNRTGMMERSLF